MKDYQKPFIEEEDIEIEDVIAVSNRGALDEFEEDNDIDDVFK